MDLTPSLEMAAASTSESMSASMTASLSSGESASMVRASVVVFPEPGELMRLTRSWPFWRRRSLNASALRSLSAKTDCLTSMTL